MKIIRTSTISRSLNKLLPGQLKFLNSHFQIVAISGYDELLEEIRSREGVEIIGVSIERKIAPYKDFISLLKLYKQFKKEKPLMVHSMTPKAGLLSMLAAKFAGVPIRIHTFTGLIFPTKTGPMQKLLITMDKILCWAATDVYPEGNGVKDDLINFKITTKPLKVIAHGNVNGIDLNYYSRANVSDTQLMQLKNKLNIREDDFVFIFVGRLVRDKGINELVTSFKKLSQIKNSKLLLVGSFEEDLDPLDRIIFNEIKSNSNIIYAGYQNDIRPYLAISNAFVFPSHREGFPNVVLQAGSMELSSIVTDINGSNEIIVEGENGTIVPVKNEDALYDAMLKFMEDKAYYNKLKEKARQMIADRYEQKVVWEALLEEYKSLEEKMRNNV